MIKLKMGELLNSTEILQKLASKELKARLALEVARMLKAIEKEMQDFNDIRMKLITKYGEKDENGELITDEKGNCKIEQEHVETFSNELNDMIAAEVEINANKLKIEQLENLDFTPAEMSALEPFIDEE